MPTWAISGGSGFLGLHLVPNLLADGIEVRSLDLEPLHPDLVVRGAVDIRGDIRSPRDDAALCAGADVLVHAAAALPSRGSAAAIRSVNVDGTATLLAEAAEAGVRRVVVLSSAVVYGLPESLPLTEATWTAPIEPYGRSKVEAERVVHEFGVRGLETVVLRPQAFVGPGRLGVFGILFDWIAEGRRIYTVGSGRNRYQLLAVEDLVAAVRLAAERAVAGETYNLGAAEFGTVAEDLAALVAHAGSTSRITPLPAEAARVGLRALAIARLSPLAEWHYRTADRDIYCDVAKAGRELGWQPRRSNAEALVRAYDWHVAHRDGQPARRPHPSGAVEREGTRAPAAPVVKRQVVLVAKAPIPGRSKTRLVPPLSAEQAAELQRALLLDTLEACRAEVPDTAILHSDPDEVAALQALAGEALLLLQEGRGLEAALAGAMARLLPAGPVALVSSDIPGIPAGALGRAFAALDRGADVVLGPALDGGYWLIAMREYHDEPFRGILWSTPAVYATTVRRCAEAGLRVHALEPWRDLDTPVDLDFALAELDELEAPRTVRVLRELRSAGIAGGEPPHLRLAASELLLVSPWRSVVSDALAGSDGSATEYAYLAVPRAVFVVPVTDEGELVLVRQYRHPVRDWTLEVPAGSVDEGESPLQAAARELVEEAGGRARDWRHLSTFYSSSAHLSLRSDAFLATGVTLEAPEPEEGEEVATVRLPVAEALARARAGGFVEGQTALSILLAAPYLEAAAG